MRGMHAIIIALASGLFAGGTACHARIQLDAELSVGTDPPERVQHVAELKLATPIVTTAPDGTQHAQVAFPLKHTAITARVAGMMAEYQVEQEF